MWRASPTIALLLILTLAALRPASSQASKKLEEKSKGMEQGQQKSWQQVDEINKETDKTRARYQKSQQQSSLDRKKTGPAVTKTRIGTATGHKKPSPLKKSPPRKKK